MAVTSVNIDKTKLLLALANNVMSFPDLGRATSISQNTLYGLKAGKPVSIKTAGKIAKALNVTVESIIIAGSLDNV